MQNLVASWYTISLASCFIHPIITYAVRKYHMTRIIIVRIFMT